MEELWDDYLQFLIWRGGLQQETKYTHLFEILHDIEFEWVLERDDNREEDGHDLRRDYEIPSCYPVEIDKEFDAHYVSVLEVLIALAIRADDEFVGDPAEEHPEEFFMEMIENLDLVNFKNNRKWDRNAVESIVQRWLNRRFEKDGRGSPFPVERDFRDQRKLEICDQMISYINEYYS